MALRTVIASKIPMVIILGATGTGKTKLSVELAQKFGTEIISADSMQIYKGLDVVTAKASRREREMAQHHLLDILEPHQIFTVVDFRNRALKIIDSLITQGKIPIIVGGTNYYIESIVYKILVEDMDDDEALLWDQSRRKRDIVHQKDDNEPKEKIKLTASSSNVLDETTTNKLQDFTSKISVTELNKAAAESEQAQNKATEDKIDNDVNDIVIAKEQLKLDVDNEKNFTNEEIHDKLKAIDPVMAGRLHTNNRRKVLRSIEVWLKTGRRHSEILAEQKLSEGELRRPDSTIIFWLKCEQTVHDERLNSRVDSMLEEGLIEELLDFHARHNKHRIQDGKPPDYTKGVFQTLGFKEFHEYLMLSEEGRNTENGRKLLQESIENMKAGTRRYARRQNKMIKGRFLEHPRREIPLIYELDTTHVTQWEENVKNKAIHIIESFIEKTKCNYEAVKPVCDDKKKNIDVNSYNYCEVCKRVILGDKVYSIHLESHRHKKVLKKILKMNENKKTDHQ
ncbi:hypothetical protein K1T71_006328 [Dendrolimus kikuchii]|uniref:Uncharacterized protein n=1 Tax=Dendrolimus kikuchii TaxID=765133 RepID=A0ACC1D402_9NEOP|nr:hypothetical protein K1T71_006328 [Dendrolimus kikuchii]